MDPEPQTPQGQGLARNRVERELTLRCQSPATRTIVRRPEVLPLADDELSHLHPRLGERVAGIIHDLAGDQQDAAVQDDVPEVRLTGREVSRQIQSALDPPVPTGRLFVDAVDPLAAHWTRLPQHYSEVAASGDVDPLGGQVARTVRKDVRPGLHLDLGPGLAVAMHEAPRHDGHRQSPRLLA